MRTHKRDSFIDFIKSLLLSPFILSENKEARYLEVLECIENLIKKHIDLTILGLENNSDLKRFVPKIGRFFTPLPLRNAFPHVNNKRAITGRKMVPPSFNDIRHLLNRAQILSIAGQLKLMTFDGDMTLYADGCNFPADSQLVQRIIDVLNSGVKVALVTAAGYPGDAKRYEQRLDGLLKGFRLSKCDPKKLEQFFVLGGECNYLFQYSDHKKGLVPVPNESYWPDSMKEWAEDDVRIEEMLQMVQEHLKVKIYELGLAEKVTIIKKMRAVGVVPNINVKIEREILDGKPFLVELSLSIQVLLNRTQSTLQTAHRSKKTKIDVGPIPFCAFNGGNDVWLDIGNKLIGVKILLSWLGANSNETLHVGDQFLSTGNDIATRSACCTVWVTNPEETLDVLNQLAIQVKGT